VSWRRRGDSLTEDKMKSASRRPTRQSSGCLTAAADFCVNSMDLTQLHSVAAVLRLPTRLGKMMTQKVLPKIYEEYQFQCQLLIANIFVQQTRFHSR